jgi:hypothetical protein
MEPEGAPVIEIGETFIPKSFKVPPGTSAQRLAWADASQPVDGPNIGHSHFATHILIVMNPNSLEREDVLRVIAVWDDRAIGEFVFTRKDLEHDWERP